MCSTAVPITEKKNLQWETEWEEIITQRKPGVKWGEEARRGKARWDKALGENSGKMIAQAWRWAEMRRASHQGKREKSPQKLLWDFKQLQHIKISLSVVWINEEFSLMFIRLITMIDLPSTKSHKGHTASPLIGFCLWFCLVSDSVRSTAHLSIYQNEPRSNEINDDKLHSWETQRDRRALFV